jgi:hypothetical protein
MGRRGRGADGRGMNNMQLRTPKKEILWTLKKARSSHIKWRSYAYAILDGFPTTAEHAPVGDEQCAFGQWYHVEAETELAQSEHFRKLGEAHRLLHEVYAEIYRLVDAGDILQAGQHREQITAASRELLDALDVLESTIVAG